MHHDYSFKVSVIGDQAVGKTALIRRITENEFKEAYEVTLGVEFGALIFKINTNRILKLQIWDTAGQESFKAITKIFY